MVSEGISTDQAERNAILGLWGVPGLGAVALRAIEAVVGSVRHIADVPVSEWLPEVAQGLSAPAKGFVATAQTLTVLAQMIRERASEGDMQIVFQGDEGYPENLVGLSGAPPLLFTRGTMGPPRKRIGMVGARAMDNGFLTFARSHAVQAVEEGFGIVSGGAMGVDKACHEAALQAGGETWAFVASGLDELDPAQASLARKILDGQGLVLTEYPPRTRAEKMNFPRRNRLIAGASDAVLVLRAARLSGSHYTASFALEYGRPLFAIPGELHQTYAEGCNNLIAEGHARLYRGVQDIQRALRVEPTRQAKPAPVGRSLTDLEISQEARTALGVLKRRPQVFEEVLGATRMDPAQLVCALSELELCGLAVQHPGRRYERV